MATSLLTGRITAPRSINIRTRKPSAHWTKPRQEAMQRHIASASRRPRSSLLRRLNPLRQNLLLKHLQNLANAYISARLGTGTHVLAASARHGHLGGQPGRDFLPGPA